MKPVPALAALAIALSGCTSDTAAYPSLAPRAVEKLGFAEPEVAVVEAKPDTALDARVAASGEKLDALAKEFAADAARAQAAGGRARGKPVGSDAWLDAQTALAQLDDWRAQTSSLLTDVDQAASERAAALLPAYPTLTALRERVAAESQRQGETIDRLQAALPAA
ncbi:hypothetical protein LPN01_02035 [Sphingomonas sp. A2-49]|uniref:hypothetical protein n=1 Tax=Sphingomonas sp. A2-49 TaxID=1391375 RepID=UPI0021CE6834|nr:hypothetical protein [Sphingomonas sp. A2-49]MCU6452852.1 hypothetical protein [Sphingomonas sp. A2-49]